MRVFFVKPFIHRPLPLHFNYNIIRFRHRHNAVKFATCLHIPENLIEELDSDVGYYIPFNLREREFVDLIYQLTKQVENIGYKRLTNPEDRKYYQKLLSEVK